MQLAYFWGCYIYKLLAFNISAQNILPHLQFPFQKVEVLTTWFRDCYWSRFELFFWAQLIFLFGFNWLRNDIPAEHLMVNKILHFILLIFELSELLTLCSPKSDNESGRYPELKTRIPLATTSLTSFYHLL